MAQRVFSAKLLLRAEQVIEGLANETDSVRVHNAARSPIPMRRAGAAENPLLSPAERAGLVRDPSPRVVLGAVRNPTTDGELLHDAAITMVCGLSFSAWPRIMGLETAERKMKEYSSEMGRHISEGGVNDIPGALSGVVGAFRDSHGDRWMREFGRWLGQGIENWIRTQTLMDICAHANVTDKTHIMLLSLGHSYLPGSSSEYLFTRMKYGMASVASRNTLELMRRSESDNELIREISDGLWGGAQ